MCLLPLNHRSDTAVPAAWEPEKLPWLWGANGVALDFRAWTSSSGQQHLSTVKAPLASAFAGQDCKQAVELQWKVRAGPRTPRGDRPYYYYRRAQSAELTSRKVNSLRAHSPRRSRPTTQSRSAPAAPSPSPGPVPTMCTRQARHPAALAHPPPPPWQQQRPRNCGASSHHRELLPMRRSLPARAPTWTRTEPSHWRRRRAAGPMFSRFPRARCAGLLVGSWSRASLGAAHGGSAARSAPHHLCL